MFIDRPHWKLPISEEPILIRIGMHLRHGHHRFYRVVRLNFLAQCVELRPMSDPPADEPTVEVSFEEVTRDYRPTMYGDGEAVKKPLSAWERMVRMQSGKLFQTP